MQLKAIHTRIIITALLIAVLLYVVDFKQLQQSLRSMSLLALCTAAVGYALTQMISAARWRVLARAAGIFVSYPRALRAFFIGMYVNAFCFGTVGGDLIRALLLTDGARDKDVCLASVVADRALGLGVLAVIGVLFGILSGSLAEQPALAYVAVAVAVCAAIGWRFVPSFATASGRILPRFEQRIARLTRAFPHDPRVLAKAASLAAVYHLAQIGLIAVIIKEMGGDVPLTYLLFAVPFINIVGTLPLSWMGVGVRETAYALFFAPHYMTKEDAILVGVIWLLGMTVASAIGGIIAMLSGDLALIRRKRLTDAALAEAQ